MRTLKKYVLLASLAVSAAAIAQELARPKSERTWHGTVLGVPYDFRPPTFDRFRHAWWNPQDPHILTPRDFGVGWAINIPRLLQRWQEEAEQDSDDGV
jgi:hypothetical protein